MKLSLTLELVRPSFNHYITESPAHSHRLKRSSHQSTTEPDGTPWLGARNNAPPSYNTTTSSGRSASKAVSPSDLREHAKEGQRILKTIDRLSHNRSFRKTVNKMFNRFSWIHQPNSVELDGSTPQVLELPGRALSERVSRIPELPGNSSEDLPPRPHYGNYEQRHAPGDLPTRVTPVSQVDRNGLHQRQVHPHVPGLSQSRFPTNLPQWSSQVLPHAHTTGQAEHVFEWMSPSREMLPLEGNNGYLNQPNIAPAATMSHSRSTDNTVSTASNSFAPVSPSYSSEPTEVDQDEVDQDRIWDDDTVVNTDYPSSSFSPDQQPDAEVQASVSPTTGYHNPYANDHQGSAWRPPTPPMAPPSNLDVAFNSSKLPIDSFERAQSFTRSQTISQQGLSAIAQAPVFKLTQCNPIGPMLGDVPLSRWERSISRTQTDNNFAPDSVHTIPSLYNNTSTLLHAGHYSTTHSYDDALSPTCLRGVPQPSAIRRGIKKILAPLACGHCDVTFKGEYQNGNLKRHMRRFHHSITISYPCRFCRRIYYRADAKRKHEWEKHEAQDCQPTKRHAKKGTGYEFNGVDGRLIDTA
jgi:hypothetical protein